MIRFRAIRFPVIRLPVVRIPATLVRMARGKGPLLGLIAILFLLVWTAAARNDESAPAQPTEVLEAVRLPPLPPRPPPGQDVLTLRQDLSALLNTPSLRRAEWSVLVVSLQEGDTLFAQDENRSLGVCAAEAQAAGQDGSGVCGDVADWGHDGLGRGVADESGWLGGRREGRAGVPRSFHRRDGVGHGALRRPGGCAAA